MFDPSLNRSGSFSRSRRHAGAALATCHSTSFRQLMAVLLGACTIISGLPPAAEAQDQATPPIRMPARRAPVTVDPSKQPELGDQFPHSDMSFVQVTPQTLPVRIQRQAPKQVDQLTQNLFVVLTHTSDDSMVEIYRKNRLGGQLGNFVTVDSIAHPYLGFYNWVCGRAIETHIAHDLLLFLIAAAKAAADDYTNADDKEVRSDVEHNLAFLSVAIRLLDPKAQVQTPGQCSLMADAEMKTLQHGLHAHSNIFNDTYNYTALRSSGWRVATEKLKNFHLCYNWLSRSSFQLNESETSGDAFRRSALLYSEIERSSVGSQPALAVWKKIEAGMRLIGCPAFTGERTLFLPDFDTVFKSRGPEAKLSLSGLADPFYRTKLLLNVRRQKPVETTAKSIFELSSNRKSQDGGAVVFRLFTPMEEPESVWMRTEAPSQEAQGPEVPIALLALRARGAQQASNLLGENIFKLEPALANSVPNLIRLVKQESAAGGTQNWPWSLFGNYLKPAQEHLQIPFKTRLWMNKRLETTFAAWVDSHVALWKPQSGQVKPGPGESGSKSSGSAGTAGSPPSATAGGAAVNFHYLEPAPDVFHQMRLQLQHQMEALEKLGYFSSDGKSQTDDFIRLLQRFETIAVREVSAQPMFSADVSLLANIDSVLEPISTAVTANMWLGTSPKLGEGESGSGVAMGLGRPGELLILLRSYRGLVLLRGASYTYYEMPGPPINVVHWNRKLEYGFLHSPFWTGDFDLPMDGLLSAPVNPASP